MIKSEKKLWWHDGVRFECQGSGQCCQSRGEYGFVYLTTEDISRFAKYFKMTTEKFLSTYCQKTEGNFHLKDNEESGHDCRFLKEKKCSVYEARPVQCRTWPFWPENMSAKSWRKEVVAFCPGVGKGKLVASEKIQLQLNQMED